MTLLGGLLVVVASFLPWLTIAAPFVGTLSRGGLDGGGDGVFTLIIGVMALGIGIARLTTSLPLLAQRAPVGLGALAVVLAGVEIENLNAAISSVAANPYVQAYLGSGLYLLIVGAIVTVAGGLGVTPPASRDSAESGAR